MSAADELEAMLLQQLSDLQRDYQQRARPIVDAITHLRSLKPRPILIPDDVAVALRERGK